MWCLEGICIAAQREVKDSTSPLLLSEPYSMRLRHIEKGIHALLPGSAGALSLCFVLPLLCYEDLVPL